MEYLIPFAVGLSVWDVVLALQAIRRFKNPDSAVPRVLQLLFDAARIVALSAFIAMILLVAIPDTAGVPGLVCTLLFLLTFFALYPLGGLRKRAVRAETPYETLATLLADTARAGARRVRRFVISVGRAISPSSRSWAEVWIPRSLGDDLLSVRSFFWVYFWLLALAFGLVLPTSLLALGNLPGATGALMRASIGFNALFAVSIFTITSLALLLLTVFLRRFGLARFAIDFQRHLKSVAAYIGYGTLAGVIAAALTPLMTAILRQPSSPAISPSMLIELPAIGAVIGYLAGLGALALTLGRGSSNLLYRSFLFPGLFVTLLFCIFSAGLSPEMLYQQLIVGKIDPAEIPATVCSTKEPDTILQEHLDNELWLLALTERCGKLALLSGNFLVRGASVSIAACAGIGFILNIRTGMKNSKTAAE